VTGQSELIGQLGVVREQLDPEGLVFVHGELWRARTPNGEAVPSGQSVRIEGLDDALTLTVSPA
jgi:membrane-bound serine protease (ClpP class)